MINAESLATVYTRTFTNKKTVAFSYPKIKKG